MERQQNRTKTDWKKVIKKAERIVGRQQESFHSAYHRTSTDRSNTILADETHPLPPEEFDS